MFPVLFELPVPGGTRPIGSYGVLFALALLVGGALFVRRAARAELDLGRVVAALALSIGGALAGAWLLFAIVEAVRTGDALAALTSGGRVFLGGLLGGALTVVLAARALRLPLATLADCAAPALPLGHAIGRLGCFLGGCCYGAPSSGPFAVTYTDASAPGAHPMIARHPWPLYEGAALLVVAALVALVPERHLARRAPGARFALYALLYGALRVALEPLRGDAVRGVVLGVSTSQLVGALVATGAALWLLRAGRLRAVVVATMLAPLLVAGATELRVRLPRVVRIPTGEVMMGSSPEEVAAAVALCRRELVGLSAAENCTEELFASETPAHRVQVSAFGLERTEVTQEAYARCVAAGECAPSLVGSSDARLAGATLPVVGVSHRDARQYCAFLGGRLPTEAEWERAARGGGRARTFPWGSGWDGRLANHGRLVRPVRATDDGYAFLAPVGSYPDGASRFGVLDLAGNVAEWVEDWFDREYYAGSPRVDPRGPSGGSLRVTRGGSFGAPSFALRTAFRGMAPESARDVELGFRCAFD
jgi:formylglycine-generating enzyme required for sulfatase activity